MYITKVQLTRLVQLAMKHSKHTSLLEFSQKPYPGTINKPVLCYGGQEKKTTLSGKTQVFGQYIFR